MRDLGGKYCSNEFLTSVKIAERPCGGVENGSGFQAEVRPGGERGERGERVREEDASEPESLSFQNLRGRRRRLKEQHRQQLHHGECRLLIPVILLPVDETFPRRKKIFPT